MFYDWISWSNGYYLLGLVIAGAATMVAAKYTNVVKEMKDVADTLEEAYADGKLTKAEKDLIELNRKEVFKAQDKMGKKEINKTVSKILKNSGLPCALANGINCRAPSAYSKSIN